ncbi:MAG: hypothetical protein JKY65_07840 [Planctomycetes bacterium]|nr:hypothetical protein [Planctomycetota bacterium]
MSATLFVGYGSLLSARGLGPQLEQIRDAELTWLRAPRQFGKPPQKGGRLAMEVVAERALLGARAGRAPDRTEGGCGALLLHVEREGEAKLVGREGYSPRCWAALRGAAGSQEIGEYLIELAEGAGDDPLAFRAELWKRTGPPKSGVVHYLPHPVRLDDGRAALVFVAPDPGQTGDPELPSCKEAHPELRGVALDELYEVGPGSIPDWSSEKQTHYVELCLLGLAHGVYLGDLFAGLGLNADHPAIQLLTRLSIQREVLLAEQRALRSAIPTLSSTGPGRLASDLDEGWELSGLSKWLNPPA